MTSMSHDLRMASALDELRELIRRQYPGAAFEVTAAPDNPSIVHLIATVDLDDTEDLVDLVIDRMIELQVDERLPLFVIPQRTPERIAVRRQRVETERASAG
jgi:hypothetical protein